MPSPPAASRRPASPMVGIGFKVASVVVFTVMAALIKSVGALYPTGEIVAFRSVFALVPLLALLAWRGTLGSALRSDRKMGHVLRGGVGVIAMALNFAGIARLPLADATAIFYAAPIFTVGLATLLLGEAIRPYRWIAALVGFCGVVLALIPHLGEGGAGGGQQTTGALLSLASAVIAAFAMIQVRRLTETEATTSIVLYFTLVSAIAGLLTLPFGWRMPTAGDALVLVTIGILGGIAQIFLTQSYRLADASLIAPFEYSSMLFALAIGYVAFGDVPVPLVWAGATLIIAAGLAVVVIERVRLGRAAAG